MTKAADLLIVGRIASLVGEEGFGWAEALAVAGGRVVFAGSVADAEAFRAPGSRVWRLGRDEMVVPGITDAHLHLVTAANAATQLDLSACRGRDDTLAVVRTEHERRAAAGDRDGWMFGNGWSLDRLGSWPMAGDLERVAPGRPIALWAHDLHSRWISSAALRAADIGSTTADPAGGTVRRDARGEPTGILHENAATLVDRAVPAQTAAGIEAAIRAYAPQLLSLGVIGVHDPGELVDATRVASGPWLYRDMAERRTLPLRVVGSIREGQLQRAREWGMRSGRQQGRARDGWLKLFSDGSLGSRSAALLEPYEAGDPGGAPVGGPKGMPLQSAEALFGAVTAATAAGIASQIHAIGDAAVRTALDVLARVPGPEASVRHRIEHAQLVHPEDVPRFASLGVAASVQPCHLCSDADAELAAWGARAAWSFPLRSLSESGALIPFGTDAPVESADPWRNVAAAVARRDPAWPPDRGPFYAEQAIPAWRALRAATLDPARSIGADDEGRLVPGARADLLVIPSVGLLRDDASGAAVSATRPLATVLDGEIVFRSEAFDPGD